MTEYTKNKNSHIMEGARILVRTKVTVQHNKTYCYRTKVIQSFLHSNFGLGSLCFTGTSTQIYLRFIQTQLCLYHLNFTWYFQNVH